MKICPDVAAYADQYSFIDYFVSKPLDSKKLTELLTQMETKAA